MDSDAPTAEPHSRPPRWFFFASFPCAAVAVGASLWWSYGGESRLAEALALGAWVITGALGFASGYRGEHRQWDVSPLVSGLLTAVITLGATLGAAAVANFRTTPGRKALTTAVTSPQQWPTLVEAEARTSGNGTVLSVLCDKSLPKDGIASCAVTYEGPKCQYWFVGSVDGEHEARADDEFFDERGTYDPSYGPLC